MEPSQRNNLLERRPSTERSRVNPTLERIRNYPSYCPSKCKDLLLRPQTNLRPTEGPTVIIPKGTRIVLGSQQKPQPKAKPWLIPKDSSSICGVEGVNAVLVKARVTKGYFCTHLPKLRPETHDLRLEALRAGASPAIKSQRTHLSNDCYKDGTERKARWCSGNNNKANNPQIPYGFPHQAVMCIGEKVYRPSSGKIRAGVPQTAQVKTRAAATVERMMRLSTPQTSSEKRPESRYNKATLYSGLHNGRDKSPDYHVPVLPMKFSENLDKQHVLPSCWK